MSSPVTMPEVATSTNSAAWQFVGSVLAALNEEHLDDGVRMTLIESAAARLERDVPWLR